MLGPQSERNEAWREEAEFGIPGGRAPISQVDFSSHEHMYGRQISGLHAENDFLKQHIQRLELELKAYQLKVRRRRKIVV